MAVAVDGERHPGGRRPGARAVEIHVARRAVDFERGPGLRGRRVERVEVEGVAVEMSDELVGRMAEHVDERMADGARLRASADRHPGRA